MMKKVYYLATCDTCKRIMNEVMEAGETWERQDIKTVAMTKAQIEEMKKRAGSYEVLFSRRARKYASMGLKEQDLKEADYKRLILEEYTFLKRPVFLVGEAIFIGNAKKNIEALKKALEAGDDDADDDKEEKK